MLLLAIPRKFKICFEKSIYFSFKKTSHMNVFSFFTNWVAFYVKFALFGDFKNIQNFFQKSNRVFLKKLNFWTFWEISVFQSQVTANLLLLGILKKSRFFEKHIFFQENRQNLAVFRTFTILVGFNSKLDNFRNFKSIEDCFSKIL